MHTRKHRNFTNTDYADLKIIVGHFSSLATEDAGTFKMSS